ncbi:MAG: uracil-DNA glycosylase family protein [Bacteroidales bacterium]|nr:uracil-DNA glycosylase family protein [Bacteroidales bacterium]
MPIEQHPLQPFLPQNGKILMLGSFPPQKKRWVIDFFYPNFTNDMWRIFGIVFFNNALHFVDTKAKTYRKDAIVDFLNTTGIGIFDTATAVRRLQDNASDKFLEIVTPTDIKALLRKMPQCHTIVTTGQKATDTICHDFNIAQPPIGHYTEFNIDSLELRLYRMPSTSRAYPLAITKKAVFYQQMFNEVL